MVGISLGTALLGSAIIGGGAAVAGASANSKAINKASSAQDRATQQSLALQRETYDRNNALLSPYNERGNAAGEAINALLGIPGVSTPAGGGTGIDWAAYVRGNPDAAANWDVVRGSQSDTFGGDISKFGAYHYNADGARRDLTAYSPKATDAGGAQSAFDNYLNSSGYKFQLGEQNKAALSQLGAFGGLDSGAAVKSAMARAQNTSTNFFNNYLSLLGGQQGIGMSAASAVAGVGQNFANASTAALNNNAANQGNLAIQKGQNTNNMLGNLSSSFGLGLGALSSFGSGGSVYGGNLGGIY